MPQVTSRPCCNGGRPALERTGTDLTLTFSDAQDRVTLIGWFEQQPRRIGKFRFSDGETVEVDAQDMECLHIEQALQMSEPMCISMASSPQYATWGGAAVLPV